MTTGGDLPLSGYVLDRVYSLYQALEHKKPATDNAAAEVSIGWDWRIARGDGITFEVKMSATVKPSAERDDLISANVIGVFRMVDKDPSVPIAEFVRLQAVAILLPYLRQLLSTLTSMSYHGAYYLPPINVAELMNDFDANTATGARQLERLIKTQGASGDKEHVQRTLNESKKGTASRKGSTKNRPKHAALKRST